MDLNNFLIINFFTFTYKYLISVLRNILINNYLVFSLSPHNVSELGATGTDQIVISRDVVLGNVASPCAANISNPSFSLNLMDCNPYISVRSLK